GDREEALLPDQLDEVGDRLQEAVRPDAVRAVAQLHATHDLALGERQIRKRDEDEVDDDVSLDRRDPPRLGVVARRGEEGRDHCFTTSTSGCKSPACSSATRATPSTSFRFTRARSSSEVPFERTSTVSPLATARLEASAVESSISAGGRWKPSSSTRSTKGPE